MIKLLENGTYRLVYTKDDHKILYLGEQGYYWGYADNIGELLTFVKKTHKTSYTLAEGKYKIYAVKDEPKLVDLRHLQLSISSKKWQGYLLLTGLPTKTKIRSKIVPTDEIITKAKK